MPDGFEDSIAANARIPPTNTRRSVAAGHRAGPAGIGPSVELIVNAEKGTAAGIVQEYSASILNSYSADLAGPARAGPRIEIRHRSRYNPTLNYKHYMVPGLLVALVTMMAWTFSGESGSTWGPFSKT